MVSPRNFHVRGLKMNRLRELAAVQQDYVVKLRRELHRHTEIRFDTEATRRLIIDEINSIISSNRGIVTIFPPRESK